MERVSLKGKKLLILTGGSAHCKLVAAAKEMGVYSIVVDYLEPSVASPAKLIADEAWMESVLDIDAIVEKCRENHVDGVLTCWNDVSQIPYYKICNQLNLPCYGTEEQFAKMTNKRIFKQMCEENGVDVIEEYSRKDIENGKIVYPVFVKPVDSRGSRGQSVCDNYAELQKAIMLAECESFSGDIIIERYVANTNSFQVTYFFVDGEPHVIRTADGYKGILGDTLDKVALCTVSPSKYTEQYMDYVNDRFIAMLKKIGIKNGPVMAQGFYDNGVFRFYDPGLRFPGVDYELIYKDIYGIDFMKAMICFALTGRMPNLQILDTNVYLEGKKAVILFPTLSAGTIQSIRGFDLLKKEPYILSAQKRYDEGDSVEWTYTVRQRLAEIDLLCNTDKEIKTTISKIQKMIDVRDSDGNNMIYMPFDVERIES